MNIITLPPVAPSAIRITAQKMGAAVDIDTVIFDVDDTLYAESCGFTKHRNGEVVEQYMVDELGFSTRAEARALRDEYFQVYHSTMKSLIVAEADGRLPPGKHFDKDVLGNYWADNCDFKRYLSARPELIESLQKLPQKKVVFTNAPRPYALKVLETLQLLQVFPEDFIFAVDDVLPACKPEAAAFNTVFERVQSKPSRAIMFEDSLKNIRAAKSLGLQTVFVSEDKDATADPSVDYHVKHVLHAPQQIPHLWQV